MGGEELPPLLAKFPDESTRPEMFLSLLLCHIDLSPKGPRLIIY